MDVPIQIKTLVADLNDMGYKTKFVQKKSISLLYVNHRNNAEQIIKLVNKSVESAHPTVINDKIVIFNLR